MKESVFELQNVSLQYTFDGPKLKEKTKMQALLIGLNMSEILYLSTIRLERGIGYPYSRHAALSLSVTF